MTEKYPGHYETVKCFELVNNYNCSKKHKCLKKILDETKIYDIIINVAETAMNKRLGYRQMVRQRTLTPSFSRFESL